MHHESRRPDESTVSILSFYKALLGTVLLTIGVILGIYVAFAAFGIIQGKEPPGIVRQFADAAGEKVVEQVNENANGPIDVPADVMRAGLYVLAFCILILPTMIASVFINAGARLMHGDAADALKKIARQLKEPPAAA